MKSNQTYAWRVNAREGKGLSARFVLLIVLPIVVALALIPAAASTLLFSSMFGANAHATFGNTIFTIVPSTTQAGGHPNTVITLNRSGTENEDIKNVIVDLPPGLIGNPEAPPTKCSQSYFSWDWCSSSQQVGSMSVNITALGFLPLNNVPGKIYVLSPSSTSAATLGYVLKPVGSQVGIINKSYIKNEITVRTSTDYGLKNSHLNLPTSTAAVLILPVPITIHKQVLTLQSRAGSGNNGKYFMLASSSCVTRQSKLTMTSVQNVTLTRYHNYTPTGCSNSALTPNPTFSTSVDNNDAGQPTGGPLNFTMSQADAAIQQSTLNRVLVTFPQGTELNTNRLATLVGCTAAEFNSAAGCPDTSMVGTASAAVPDLPPTFTGKIFALGQGGGTTIGSSVDLAIVVNGARGLSAKFRGTASVEGAGAAQRVVADFDNLPEIPLSALTTTFTEPLLVNSYNCGSNTVTAELTGHNGATATRTASYMIDTCPPNAVIDPIPDSPTNNTTPAVSFYSTDPVGSTFECTFDSSTVWTPCTSGQTFGPLTEERGHLFRVRACKPAGNCSQVPDEALINIDTTAPALSIISPTEGEDFTVDDVAVTFTTDGVSTRCQVDDPVDDGGADWEDCGLTSHLFPDLSDGSHEVCVAASDAAGNVTQVCRGFDVNLDVDCTDLDPANCTPTVNITGGPRGGLKLTENDVPQFDFEDDAGDTPARGFECSIDGDTYAGCATGISYAGLGIGPHTFEVRAWGDNTRQLTTTGAAALATFEIKAYEPNFEAEFFDNINNLLPNNKAAQHPDVEVTMTNDAGDPKYVQFALPDGFWGSLGAVPTKCEQADLVDGICPLASKIGTVELTAVTDENVSHTFTSDLFMVTSSEDNDGDLDPEALASIGSNLHIAYDGNDYGYLREDAQLSFSARYVRDNPSQANVDDPRGIDTVTNNLPHTTDAHPGVDGVANLHVRELKLHLDGETGEDEGRNLVTAPSSCDYRPAFGITEDSNANFWGVEVPYTAEDCGDVGFTPSVFQSYSPTNAGFDTTPTATLSVADGESTIRNAVIDLPYSVQPQFAGLADKCTPANTRLIPPACTDASQMVGTVVVDTPLLPYQLGGTAVDAVPGIGKVYLETSGAPLPNLYIYVYDPVTDLDVRLRAGIKTEGLPSHLVFTINAEANGNVRDIPDIPITNLLMELPGSATYGEIALISTDCYTNDTTSGDVTGWNGSVFPYEQDISFGPGCPN